MSYRQNREQRVHRGTGAKLAPERLSVAVIGYAAVQIERRFPGQRGHQQSYKPLIHKDKCTGGQKEIRTVDMGINQGLLSLGNVARIRRAISNVGPENRARVAPESRIDGLSLTCCSSVSVRSRNQAAQSPVAMKLHNLNRSVAFLPRIFVDNWKSQAYPARPSRTWCSRRT